MKIMKLSLVTLLNSGMSISLEVADLSAAIKHLTVIGYPPPERLNLLLTG
jgi:hypothetical protein